jgi:hypothetical protein
MAKKIESRPSDGLAQVEAVAMFRHDGIYRNPGDVLVMSAKDADELVAVGFVKRTRPAGYKDRAMRATKA